MVDGADNLTEVRQNSPEQVVRLAPLDEIVNLAIAGEIAPGQDFSVVGYAFELGPEP